jgi:hypothetical protein|tara:strand:- start:128 stop:814 length:687 start_codon:yes stop_codon:yes gene_type:complete
MKITDDDKIKLTNMISMTLMFVKIVIACFPFLVVPQKCENFVCTNQDKFYYWNYAFVPNLMSFVSFLNLYYVQYKREMFLIDKFDEDDEIAEDELNTQIKKPEYKEIYQGIILLNKRIIISNQICFYGFVVNTAGSFVAIMALTYLDTTTLTVLLTNSMLIHSKILQIKKISQCDDLAMSTVSVKQRVYNIIDRDISGEKKHIIQDDKVNDNLSQTQEDIATSIMQIS